ncbi:MAG: hypothetical protein HUJ30_02415 [Gammaproteobacteria bacterium]|nr:hypothetical protein [Gammaproteobacteria bacterium]
MEEKEKKSLRKIKAIRLEKEGVKAVGPYKAGEVYKVGEGDLTLAEANRLVDAKGFTEVEG